MIPVDESLEDGFIGLARQLYKDEYIPLHRPLFEGREKQYLIECIDSNFVSSVGKKVDEFEAAVASFAGADFGVATVNGTSALHIAMVVSGVKADEEVITQAVTFVATCNAISYAGASPIFVDVDRDTMGLSPVALERFLVEKAERRSGGVFNRETKKRIAACVPMHTFGFPCRIKEIARICKDWGLPLIEDAAESLGSFVGDRHTGTFGSLAAFSFNGNKIITSGGGGVIVTNDSVLAERAKHLTTTAKLPHPFEFIHDEIGYNYRMPNLNAALGCAQIEQLDAMLKAKAEVARKWGAYFDAHNIGFVRAVEGNIANHWLNTIILSSKEERDSFLRKTNEEGIMTRPLWRLMSKLPMYENATTDTLENSIWLEDRLVNIPSSALP